MAYAYQQNMFDGAAEGYVKYDITPAFGAKLGVGDTFTITGQAYWRDSAFDKVEVSVGTELTIQGGLKNAYATNSVNVNVAKGKTGTFTLVGVVTERLVNAMTARNFTAYIKFDLYSGMSGSGTFPVEAQKITVLRRIAPSVSTPTFTDSTPALATFGAMAQNASNISVSFTATPDPLDSEVAIERRVLTIGGTEFVLDSGSATIGVLNCSTAQDYSLVVTDNKGMSTTKTGTLAFVPYSAPAASDFTVDRYSAVQLPDGSYTYEPDDDSPLVWLDLTGTVASVNGLNAWTATVTATGFSAVVASGSDGSSISRVHDREAITASFSETSDWLFTLTLADKVTSVVYRCRISRTGGIFNIERYGVAVGTRSSGTVDAPKFESAWPAYFSGGIYDADGNEIGGARYSTTPQPCGKWIDGSTVYRVVVVIPAQSNGTYNVTLPVTVGTLVNLGGAVKNTDGHFFPINGYYNSTYRHYARLSSATNMICVSSKALTGGYAVIDYIPG